MCGIAGYVGNGDLQLLKRMCETMKHRGPDDEGFWLGDAVGLGHRRLSIIDLATGHQPMCNEDQTVWIAFNGEIYNHRELRDELQIKGHAFKTNSDTEVIIHAYEEYGTDCPQHLRGMFAFAIWNANTRELFCARDRLGIKPFFYCQVEQDFVFASEAKALLEHPHLHPTLNPSAFHEYMSFGFVPGPETIYEGIRTLQPGGWVLATDGRIVRGQYWHLEGVESECASFAEAKEQLLRLLSDSVRMRLIADVPIGAYLSGGLDSSLLVSLMCSITNTNVNTFSVGFDEEKHDETGFSALVAEGLGTKHHLLRSTSLSRNLLPTVAYHLDQPMSDAAAIPTYQMAELTRRHIKVVLTGEGADECFSGYQQLKYLRYLVDPITGFLMQLAGKAGRFLLSGRGTRKRSLELMANAGSLPDMMGTVFGRFSLAEKRLLYGPAMHECLSQLEARHKALIEDKLGTGSPYQRAVSFYLQTYIADDLLVKTDRMTMAHSIEARVPYLDHKLVEFALSLPRAWKVRGWTDKYILRHLGRDWLPAAIWKRPKQGFAVPMEEWGSGQVEGRRRDIRKRLASSGLIHEANWTRWADTKGMPGRDETQRRVLLFFEEWAAAFADKMRWSGE